MTDVVAAVASWDGKGNLPLLYSKTSKGATNTWLCWVDGGDVLVQWGQEGGALQVARFSCKPKNVGRANATTAEQQAVAEAISKWKKQVLKKYHWERTHWENNTNKKPMLANKYDVNKVEYPVLAQPKLDGLRCFAYTLNGEVVLQSRGGKFFTVRHIQEQLTGRIPEGVTLDGELYCHGTSLQTINSWVKRPQEDSHNLAYVLYDIVDDAEPDRLSRERQAALTGMFESSLKGLTHIFQIQTVHVGTHDFAKELHDRWVVDGFEGAIIRLHHGVYRYGYRSSELLKMKEFEDDEFEIVGWERGKGKFYTVPTFQCRSPRALDPNASTFGATFKGTEAERAAMCDVADQQIGKMLTVRFFNYTPDGLPFHPHGIAVREPGT